VTREQQLDELYARLPKLECKGLCQECCGPIGLSLAERRRIERTTGERYRPALTCPLLDHMGQCSAYAVRPMVCRLWGVVEDMPCPHGCVPEGGHLSSEEGRALMERSLEIGGEDPIVMKHMVAILSPELARLTASNRPR
jgi:hypothetical protein